MLLGSKLLTINILAETESDSGQRKIFLKQALRNQK